MDNIVIEIKFEESDKKNSNQLLCQIVELINENGGRISSVDIKKKTLLQLM